MDKQRPFELGSLEIRDCHADLLAAFPRSVLELVRSSTLPDARGTLTLYILPGRTWASHPVRRCRSCVSYCMNEISTPQIVRGQINVFQPYFIRTSTGRTVSTDGVARTCVATL